MSDVFKNNHVRFAKSVKKDLDFHEAFLFMVRRAIPAASFNKQAEMGAAVCDVTVRTFRRWLDDETSPPLKSSWQLMVAAFDGMTVNEVLAAIYEDQGVSVEEASISARKRMNRAHFSGRVTGLSDQTSRM